MGKRQVDIAKLEKLNLWLKAKQANQKAKQIS